MQILNKRSWGKKLMTGLALKLEPGNFIFKPGRVRQY